MTRLFGVAGVDYAQWKALTIAALKLDFRQTSVGRPQGGMGRDSRGVGALISQLVIYTLFGLFMAMLTWFSDDLALVGALLSAYTLFIVGTAVLLDHNSALTSPVDYLVLGFRPISSRTYFAVRLANVLAYTTAITTAAAWLPAGALFLRQGPAVGAAGLATLYGSSLFAALVILLGYASVVRLFGPATIRRALSYLQLLLSFFVYGGYFLLMRSVSRAAVASLALPETPWLWLFPGTWFASWMVLAGGSRDLVTVLGAVGSALSVVLLAAGLGGRLSLDYSARLGTLATSSERRSVGRPRRLSDLWFRSGEGRAVAMLVRSQFRNDQRFRMSVLAILPLTILYVAMAAEDGAMADPFESSGGRFSLVIMAVMFFPAMLKMSLTRSDTFQASWIFFACPADRIRIIRSTRDVLLVFFLLPYLAFVALVYGYFVPNVLHVLVHVSLMGLVSALVLQIQMLMEPELPFSKPPVKGQSSRSMFVFMFILFAFVGVLQALSPWIYGSMVATTAAFGIVVLTIAAVDRLTRARVASQAQTLEFLG